MGVVRLDRRSVVDVVVATMITRILLDVDGVLADFVGGVCKAFDRDKEQVIDTWPTGTYDIVNALGITQGEFCEKLDGIGAPFWDGLEPYPWATEFYEKLSEHAPVTLLTSCSRDPGSAAGKLSWIKRLFGDDFRSYLIGPDKTACAHPGAILIDDYERNTKAFDAAGGHSIVFPRVWNSHHKQADLAVETVLYSLHRWKWGQ